MLNYHLLIILIPQTYGNTNISHSRQSVSLLWGHVCSDELWRQTSSIVLRFSQTSFMLMIKLQIATFLSITYASWAALALRPLDWLKLRFAHGAQGLATICTLRAKSDILTLSDSRRLLSHLAVLYALIVNRQLAHQNERW